MAKEWTDEELRAAVDAYRSMMDREARGEKYSKLQIYQDLSRRFGRSVKAFEYRMQNISAVLQENNDAWLAGLKPAVNVGANVRSRLTGLLGHPDRMILPGAASVVSYKEKLPAIREWLIETARHKGMVTYGDIMQAFGIDRFSLRHGMDLLGHQAVNLGEPVLTALIVNKKTKRCSAGLEKEFGVLDDGAERQRLYDFWRARDRTEVNDVDAGDSLEAKAAKFVSVEVRPDQATFRRRVFLASGGRCVISGCDLLRALDAAHRKGRNWRLGHNSAEDGYLLRKDLHALYDSGLLRITDDGVVEFEPLAMPHYKQFAGLKITIPPQQQGFCGKERT